MAFRLRYCVFELCLVRARNTGRKASNPPNARKALLDCVPDPKGCSTALEITPIGRAAWVYCAHRSKAMYERITNKMCSILRCLETSQASLASSRTSKITVVHSAETLHRDLESGMYVSELRSRAAFTLPGKINNNHAEILSRSSVMGVYLSTSSAQRPP